MKHGIKLLYLLLAILLVFTFWPQQGGERGTGLAWNINTDPSGRVEVLGVTLGATTLKQAEQVLRSRSERALFIPSDKDARRTPVIEAYFPSLPDGARLVLGLAADAAFMDQVKAKAYNPYAFPSGSIKLEIAEEHMPTVTTLTVETLTYIPRIKLTPADIEARFGQAAERVVQEDIVHYLYPAMGLDAIMDASGEAMLQFVSPSEFDRVRATLRAGKPSPQ